MRRDWLRESWVAKEIDGSCAMPGCKERARYFGSEGWCARHTEPEVVRVYDVVRDA